MRRGRKGENAQFDVWKRSCRLSRKTRVPLEKIANEEDGRRGKNEDDCVVVFSGSVCRSSSKRIGLKRPKVYVAETCVTQLLQVF